MYVYMLECSGNNIYTGYAADIKKRMKQHKGSTKGGAKYTKSHKPIKILALWQTETKSDAMKLECSIKKLSRDEKNKLIADKISLPYQPELFNKVDFNDLNKLLFL